jgi:hypothetical protein
MADAYVNPLLAAVYERYGIMDDTAATTDDKLVAEYRRMEKILADYRDGGINDQVLKQWSDSLKANASVISSTQRQVAAFNETAAKSDRVDTQAIADLRRNINDNRTKLATQGAQIVSTRFNPALAKFQSGGVSAAMSELTRVLEAQGVRPDIASPDMAALMEQVSTRFFGKPLDQITPDEAAAMVGPNPQLQQQTRELFTYGKAAMTDQTRANEEISTVNDQLEQLASTSGGVIAGAQIQEAQRLAAKLAGLVEASTGMSATDMREEMERVAALDSTYQKLQQDSELLQAAAFKPGKEGLRSKIGRVVATDEFRAWAEDNGFRIGQAALDGNKVVYVPGRDDERALIAYGRQMKTGAPIRLFGTSNTGKLVRITATDPEERARLLQQNDLGGGRYVLDEDGKSLLSPTSYMRRLQTDGYMSSGVDVAQANGVTYVKSGGQTLKYANGKFVPLAEGETAPTDWKPAMVYTEGDKGRYMTAADLDNPPAVADIGFVTPEDKKAIEASSPYKIVTADQLPSLGEVTFEGYLDKANARTIAEHGTGAVSLNGGQRIFTKGVKVEVLETRGRETPPVNVRERRAERRAEGLGGLTPEQVRTARATGQPAADVTTTAVGAPAIAVRAAADEEFAPERLESLVAGGTVTTAQAAEAVNAVAEAQVAAAAAPETPAAAPATTAPATATAAAAPAVPAAPAAPKTDRRYFEASDGAQYRVDRSGVTMVTPARGEVLPATEGERTYAIGSPEAEVALGRRSRSLSQSEGEAIEGRMVGGSMRATPPIAKIEERRGSTFIDYGKRRNIGTDIREAVDRMKTRREEKRAERNGGAPAAAPPTAKSPFERKEEERRRSKMLASLETAADIVPEKGPPSRVRPEAAAAELVYKETELRPGRLQAGATYFKFPKPEDEMKAARVPEGTPPVNASPAYEKAPPSTPLPKVDAAFARVEERRAAEEARKKAAAAAADERKRQAFATEAGEAAPAPRRGGPAVLRSLYEATKR